MHVEGIIACLAQNTTDYSHFEEIADMGIPLVFFGRTCMTDKFSTVTANGDEAAQRATDHLIKTGSRRIAFIGGPNHIDMVKRRKHGYLEALREHRIPIDREVVVCDKIDYNTALENTLKLLSRDDRPDAILAFNDIITFAAYAAIRQLKLKIPDDIFKGQLVSNDGTSPDSNKFRGIGLAVCKSIITAHGGKISADNKPVGGAVFTFTLPLEPEEIEE